MNNTRIGQKLAQESEENLCDKEGNFLLKCVCHMYDVGKVIVIEGLRKSKVG